MRGKQAPKRLIIPDYKYKNIVITKLIHQIMRKGKKTVAQKVIYSCFANIEKRTKKNPVELFEKAMANIAPVIEVRSRRVGGSNYQIPVEVRGNRRITLALRWLIESARGKKGKSMGLKLADEILEAANMRGDAVKKKQNIQRMAESNRAFAHFA